MEMLLLIVAKIYLKTVVITFLETSKLVGLIMSGWNVTFWPSVNMQHCPARLQWDKYRLKRKENNKSREEIFYQMKVVFFVKISCRKCFL